MCLHIWKGVRKTPLTRIVPHLNQWRHTNQPEKRTNHSPHISNLMPRMILPNQVLCTMRIVCAMHNVLIDHCGTNMVTHFNHRQLHLTQVTVESFIWSSIQKLRDVIQDQGACNTNVFLYTPRYGWIILSSHCANEFNHRPFQENRNLMNILRHSYLHWAHKT
jgi:hypothetical protein